MSDERPEPTYSRQLIGSLIVAALIVVAVIALVTAKIGPGLDAPEQREGYERQEELREEREERIEERREG